MSARIIRHEKYVDKTKQDLPAQKYKLYAY